MKKEPELKKIRVALYVRVSTDEQAEMFGEELQLTSMMKYIESRHDLELAGEEHIYKDIAVSGAEDIDDRDGLGQLFYDLTYNKEAPFDTVMVYKIDRFARKLRILLEVIDRLSDHEIGFISSQEAIDTSTPFGNAMLGILGVFAELERDMIYERTRSGKDESLARGTWTADKYGYRRDENKRPVIQRDEAKIIQKIYELFVFQDMSIAQICDILSEQKILIPGASMNPENAYKRPYKWGDKTVRDILADETYIGLYYYYKTKRITDPKTGKKKQINLPKEERTLCEVRHVPIIDKDIFDAAQKRLGKKFLQAKAKNPYLLEGLVKCDTCKHMRERGMIKWMGKNQDNKNRYYQCSGKSIKKYGKQHQCKVLPISEKELDKIVIHHIKHIIKRPRVLEDYVKKTKQLENKYDRDVRQLEKVTGKISKLTLQLQNIKDMYEMDDLTRNEYLFKKENIQLKIKDLKQEQRKMMKVMNEESTIKGYNSIFANLNNYLKGSLSDIFKQKDKLKRLLNIIIEEVVVYSRLVNDEDQIKGRRVEGQRITDSISITMKLPEEIIALVGTLPQDFGKAHEEELFANDDMRPHMIDLIRQIDADMGRMKTKISKTMSDIDILVMLLEKTLYAADKTEDNVKGYFGISEKEYKKIRKYIKKLIDKLKGGKGGPGGISSEEIGYMSFLLTKRREKLLAPKQSSNKKITSSDRGISQYVSSFINFVRGELFRMGRSTGLEPAILGTTNRCFTG